MNRKAGTIAEEAVEKRRHIASELGGMTGWAPDPSELGDFLHRIRRFPDSVATWRKGLVASILADLGSFPAVPSGASAAEVRGLMDECVVLLREIATILSVLHGTPDHGNKSDPLDELVYIILSRKTREGAYQETFEALRKRFPTWEGLLRARRATVEKLVRSGGLSSKKTDSLFGALKRIKEEFGECSLDALRDWPDDEIEQFLCGLPEVSRKSAYCVMMYSMGRSVFPVDTHVGRILARLGVFESLGLRLDELDHKKRQSVLINLIPPELRYSLHVNLVSHGREVCTARNPGCDRCEIRKLCRYHRRSQVQIAAESDSPTLVDFFCGAGGLSAGFVRSGFRPVLALDSDPASCRTYRINHPMVPDDAVMCCDARYLQLDEIRKRIGKKRIDVLAGGPPCQGFSLVGHKTKGHQYRKSNLLDFITRHESRNYLFEVMVGAAVALKPRVVLMENVPGMAASRKGSPSFMDQAATMLKDAGYTTTIWKLEASSYGVPQRRRRAFLVASLDGRLPQMPEADYQGSGGGFIDPDALDPIRLDWAIYDLPALEADEGVQVVHRSETDPEQNPLSRHYLDNPAFRLRENTDLVFNHRARYNNENDLELFGLLEPGENGRDALERHGRRDLMRYRTDVFDDKYSRLRPDQPCRTIVSHLSRDGNSFIHPTQVRTITVREGARIQSFPDDFLFCGAPSDQWTQVGNSVPPLLAARLARTISEHLKGFSR